MQLCFRVRIMAQGQIIIIIIIIYLPQVVGL